MVEPLSLPAKWVDDQKTFDQVNSRLKGCRHLGVDTESNSLHAYQEQVCLIQFTDHQTDYLIDAMAPLDLSGLSSIFSDEKIEKIFHAAEYDILCLKRDYGFEFSHLFDTMQAARILGMEKLGLSGLLTDLLDIDQGKSFQKADWGKRPVPEEMR
jgi:ribonuclease D